MEIKSIGLADGSGEEKKWNQRAANKYRVIDAPRQDQQILIFFCLENHKGTKQNLIQTNKWKTPEILDMHLRPGLSEETGTQLPKLWYEQLYKQGGSRPRADLLLTLSYNFKDLDPAG